MTRTTIFRRGVRLLDAQFTSSCTLTDEISETSELSAEFSLPNFFGFMRGDYIVVEGRRFMFTEEPTVQMKSRNEYKYTARMKDESAFLEDYLFMFLDEATDGRIYATRCEFDLTATIGEFLSLIVRNMNRMLHGGWSYSIEDNGIDMMQTKDMTFSNQTCMDALRSVCEDFGLEWSISATRCIRVAREFRRISNVTLSYPDNLLSPVKIEHTDSEENCTRLYVFGGERNIPKDYNGGLSNRLLMSGKREYIDRNTRYTRERVKVFDDIYPRRNGFVQKVNINQNGIHFITDNSIDFDINSHLTDTTAKIAFTSGRLVGYEFEIADYNRTANMIEIKQKTEDGVVIPNETLRAEQGDRYVLLDIIMPDEYVIAAEKELDAEAEKYYEDKCQDKLTASIEVSSIWKKENGVTFLPSDMVTLKVQEMGIERKIRVTKVVSYPFDSENLRTKQQITLSDFVIKSRIRRMENEISASERLRKSVRKKTDNFERTSSQISAQLTDSISWNQ